MIEFRDVTITYPEARRPTLVNVDLHVTEGELCLVIGPTGSGKSTLLKAVNGLVPHFTGGTLQGSVSVAGRDTSTHPPRELADVVGVVGQDPASGFVTDSVEEELAYGMESLGLAPDVMRRRVEETLDILGLADLRARPLSTLSGGQQQRVAIGSVLTAHPSILVLDEPTSALDPPAAEEVLAAIQRLVHDVGLTVLLAEHRLERVLQYADRVVQVPGDGAPVRVGTPGEIVATTVLAPPIVELGRLLGWSPLPLSVRDARRAARPLRDRLSTEQSVGIPRSTDPRRSPRTARHGESTAPGTVATARGVTVSYGPVPALRAVDLRIRTGEVIALMGRNGAGKSTLLHTLTGLRTPTSGTVRLGDRDPRDLTPRELISRAGLVPQQPADLLYADTVDAECRAADGDARTAPGTCRALVDRVVPELTGAQHPRDLSEGQRLALVLAIVLTAEPPLLLLDEPTRGLDYHAKARLVTILDELARNGHSIVVATHDVELAASVATRTVVLADGEIVVDGPTTEVVTSSPSFAPQVAKILAPLPLLTVTDVTRELERAP